MRFVRRLLTAAVLSTALVACTTVGPDYRRPDMIAAPAWSAAASAAMASAPDTASRPVASPADVRAWWKVFGDPVLDQLIDDAARQNLDVQTAAVRIAEARTQRDVTASSAFPSVGLAAVGGRERMSQNGIGSTLGGGAGGGGGSSSSAGSSGGTAAAQPSLASGLYQIGFDATWEIDFFGKVRRNVEAADADTEAAADKRNDALTSVSAEIARTYLSLRGSQEQLAIVERDIGVQRRIVALTDSRNRAGFTPQSDVSTQSGQLASAQAQKPQLEQSAAQARNRLAFLLALPPGALADRLAGARADIGLPPEVPIGLPGDLLRRRPDVRNAEAQLHAATARIGVARAQLFPSVTLGLFGGLQATRAVDLRDWASRFSAGGAEITLPLFQGGQLKAQLRLADLRAQEAALGYRQTVLTAYHDADNALSAYADEQHRSAALLQQLEQALHNRRLAQHRYDAGLAPRTDVLNGERSVHQTSLSLSQSETAARTDLVALYKALGGGWSDDDAQSH